MIPDDPNDTNGIWYGMVYFCAIPTKANSSKHLESAIFRNCSSSQANLLRERIMLQTCLRFRLHKSWLIREWPRSFNTWDSAVRLTVTTSSLFFQIIQASFGTWLTWLTLLLSGTVQGPNAAIAVSTVWRHETANMQIMSCIHQVQYDSARTKQRRNME